MFTKRLQRSLLVIGIPDGRRRNVDLVQPDETESAHHLRGSDRCVCMYVWMYVGMQVHNIRWKLRHQSCRSSI